AQHSITAPDGDTEGLPVSILEAMACSLPVVATRHAGIPEAVEDGVSGFLVAEKDVNGMAIAMADLLENPERAKTMGMAGRERVCQNFTTTRSGERLRFVVGLDGA